jgi:quercetin 2,3-dioxygenase
MSLRIVSGEIGAKDVTTRVILPTAAQPRWPPFERVAETIATARRRFPPHRHAGVEVLTYVIEGGGTYDFTPQSLDPIEPGSARLLVATNPVSHAVNPGKGQTIRWFAVVAALAPGSASESRLLSAPPEPSLGQPDGTRVRRLVGPGTPLHSIAGLECDAIEFESRGAAFRKVGHDRIAVCYAVSGRGAIDNQPLDGGEAALIDDLSGISIAGAPGFHVILTTAPRGA